MTNHPIRMAEFALDVLSPLGALGTSLVVIDDEGRVESSSATGVNRKMRRQFCPLTIHSPVPAMEAWRTTDDVFVGSREELDERFPEYTTIDRRVGSLAALLLTHHGVTVGTLTVSFAGQRYLDLDVHRALQSLSSFLAHLTAEYRVSPHRHTDHVRHEPAPSVPTNTTVTVRDVVIDLDGHQVYRGDEIIHITRREFEVFSTLVRHGGQVLSKRQLLDLVWGYDGYDENVVETNICSLRRKLGPRADLIETVRGFGYVIRNNGGGGGEAEGSLPRRARA